MATIDPSRPIHLQTDAIKFDPAFEIPKQMLKLDKLLGEGHFGKVWKGLFAVGLITEMVTVKEKCGNNARRVAPEPDRNLNPVRDRNCRVDQF